jgi:hypothetical protein
MKLLSLYVSPWCRSTLLVPCQMEGSGHGVLWRVGEMVVLMPSGQVVVMSDMWGMPGVTTQ